MSEPTATPGPAGENGGLAADDAAAAGPASRVARRQEQVAEHEREQLTWRLHDEVIRELLAVSLSLESARPLAAHAPDRADNRLGAAVDSLDDIIRQLRNHVFRLRPGEAAAMGLTRGLADLDLDARVSTALVPDLPAQPSRDAVERGAAPPTTGRS